MPQVGIYINMTNKTISWNTEISRLHHFSDSWHHRKQNKQKKLANLKSHSDPPTILPAGSPELILAYCSLRDALPLRQLRDAAWVHSPKSIMSSSGPGFDTLPPYMD
jgi:hypothetical protein